MDGISSLTEDSDFDKRDAILKDLFAGRLSEQNAAEALASLSLGEDPRHEINATWVYIMDEARASSEHLEKLIGLLVNMANLPAAKNEDGQQLMVYNMRVWDELPTLGWEFNHEWNSTSFEGPKREGIVDGFVNINEFAARLVKSGVAEFSHYDLFAVWTMRAALETPIAEINTDMDPPDAYIPAAARWISFLGAEMLTWDKEFPYGHPHGDPGGGGPLWNGQHGPCKERWRFWRKRFGELSVSDELSEELREMAKESEAKMAVIEAQSTST